MNITQEPATNTVPPFPFFVENPVDLHPNELPTNKNNINSEPLKSQISEIPFPSHFHIDTNPLPDRCQFFFSDGRQCTMARSDIHPSLCRFHAEREEQLFGDPAPGGNVVGRALDLPELYSACRDLTTAAGVNRALGQVFRLLAQRRISRQEAATFGHLAQLLLRTISVMRAESLVTFGEDGLATQSKSTLQPKPNEKAAASCSKDDPPAQLTPLDSAPIRKVEARKSHQEQTLVSKPWQREPQRSSTCDCGANTSMGPKTADPLSQPQAEQTQHLHKTELQLAQNQHLQDCST